MPGQRRCENISGITPETKKPHPALSLEKGDDLDQLNHIYAVKYQSFTLNQVESLTSSPSLRERIEVRVTIKKWHS
jgi:hypothetical protein